MLTERELSVFLLDFLWFGGFVYVKELIGATLTSNVRDGGWRMYTHFSLNALRIRSTSISRWKAVASRLSNFSMSASSTFGVACLLVALDDDEACPDMIEMTWGLDDR